MIQDIEPHRFSIGYSPRIPAETDRVFAYREGKALLRESGGAPELPDFQAVKSLLNGALPDMPYLFSVDGEAFFLLADAPDAPEGFFFQDVGQFRSFEPSWMGFAGITAAHLAQWYARTRFCGSCGAAMAHKEDERAMLCPSCRNIVYPAISPAVIVAVIDGDRLVMTKYANRPFRNYALIAGFMEVGETLEDTVRREVMEEVGVRVKNIRYYKSQPWGFSNSLLAGFFADLDGDDTLRADQVELEEALWFARDEIVPRGPDISLTSEMIEVFRRGDVAPAESCL